MKNYHCSYRIYFSVCGAVLTYEHLRFVYHSDFVKCLCLISDIVTNYIFCNFNNNNNNKTVKCLAYLLHAWTYLNDTDDIVNVIGSKVTDIFQKFTFSSDAY